MKFVVLAGACAACSYDAPTATSPIDAGVDAGVDAAIDTVDRVWLDGWSHRKPITLLSSAIEAPEAGLIDFPVLISITDPEIAAAALADGADLAFTTADGATLLSHEVERLAGDDLVAWVKIPTLLDADTLIYVYYGNPAPPATDATLVWTADFVAVYHLNQDPGPGGADEIRDATGVRHATAEASMTTEDLVDGQIGQALAFDGDNDFLNVGAVDLGQTFTISTWVNVSSDMGIQTVIANSPGGASQNGYRFFINTQDTADGRIFLETGNGANAESIITPQNTMTPNTWRYLAATVDRGAGTAAIYLDGVQLNNNDPAIRTDFATNSDFEIGRMESNTNHYGGLIDELQIASVLRPVEWLKTAHANQHSPATFISIGPQETLR